MKRRGRASCAICRKSFLRPSWYMRSAGHSSRQRRDGPSIRIGATTRFGPINSPARSLPLAARRKDGCGKSESRNRGHWSVFGRPQQLQIEPPQMAGIVALDIGAQQIAAFAPPRLP